MFFRHWRMPQARSPRCRKSSRTPGSGSRSWRPRKTVRRQRRCLPRQRADSRRVRDGLPSSARALGARGRPEEPRSAQKGMPMTREPLVEDIQTYAQNIVDTVREPLLILDTTLRVRSANRAFYQAFHVSSEETEDRLIYELGNGQWDIPDLRTLLEDIVPKSSVFDDFELEHTFPVIGRRV